MKPWIGTLFIMLCLKHVSSSHLPMLQAVAHHSLSDVDIECNSQNIVVKVSTGDADFNGMIYPKGLSKNSTCLSEYEHAGNTVTYRLPLRACNTMSHDVKEGVEYFNTVVIQPHHKLVTSQGKGFHVRCRYQTNKTSEGKAESPKSASVPAAPLPGVSMKIYSGRPDDHKLAEHVKIGDYLSLVITLDPQDSYGLKVTNCLVKDGLSWAEQPLVNTEGCPINEDILGPFEYSEDLTRAQVTYPAHKFPFTSSVYYQCNVKLCDKRSGGCEDAPPVCDGTGHNVRRRRRRRQTEEVGNLDELRLRDEDIRDRSVEVFSGLYVNELEDDGELDRPSLLSSSAADDFCVSTRKFAIGIAVAGLLLILAVVLLIACIVHRRRRRKGHSSASSSLYSGPYSNRAYSRD